VTLLVNILSQNGRIWVKQTLKKIIWQKIPTIISKQASKAEDTSFEETITQSQGIGV
jgi:exosome complex RNA-binding protein Rrp4